MIEVWVVFVVDDVAVCLYVLTKLSINMRPVFNQSVKLQIMPLIISNNSKKNIFFAWSWNQELACVQAFMSETNM